MKKQILLFSCAFLAGCVIALAARTALFEPNTAAAAPAAPREGHAMVENRAAPSGQPPSKAASPSETEHRHAPAAVSSGAASAEPAPTPASQDAARATVNTVCPICGMDVDPALKPADYKGQKVGFGCRMCPPKFARDPEKYGPAALANKVVEE